MTFADSDKKWSFIDSDIFHHNIFAFLTDMLPKNLKSMHVQTTFSMGIFQNKKGTEKTNNFLTKKNLFARFLTMKSSALIQDP